MPDLWPNDFGGDLTVTPPITILREQANRLTDRTQGILQGLVTTDRDGDNFVHRFYVVAPSLDNYTYLLFAVNHPVLFYPAVLFTDAPEQSVRSDTPEQFQDNLRTVLASDRTMRVIKALLAQIQQPVSK